MSETEIIRVPEQWTVETADGRSAVRVYEQWAIVLGTKATDYLGVQEQTVVYAVGGPEVTSVAVTEQWVLFVADTVVPSTPVSAWTYQIDGHLFYGLNLGSQGTAVLDVTTGRWSNWYSGTLPLLNMNITVEWRGETYGASLFDNTLLRFDPSVTTDEGFRENTFVASGRLEYQDRAFVAVPEAQVFGSIGLRGGEVTLRYSNDDGATWSEDRTVDVAAGARGENVLFYDMGSLRAPGRLFEIEDTGTLRRLSALRVRLDNGE